MRFADGQITDPVATFVGSPRTTCCSTMHGYKGGKWPAYVGLAVYDHARDRTSTKPRSRWTAMTTAKAARFATA